MEYEAACDRICNNIATLLVEMGPTPRAAFAAARATRGIADALHHAAGLPNDDRWFDALTNLETFLEIYGTGPRRVKSPALAELRGFLNENGLNHVHRFEANELLDGWMSDAVRLHFADVSGVDLHRAHLDELVRR